MTSSYNFQSITEVGKYQNDYRYRDAAIGDSGKVAFIAHVSPIKELIQLGDGSTLTIISEGPHETFRPPVVNKNDEVAFWSRNSGEGESILIWDAANGLTTAIDTASSRSTKLGLPALNNDGTLVFPTTRDDDSRELRTWNSGSSTRILDDSGKYVRFSRVEINDRGVVACRSTRDDGARVILAVDESETVEVKNLSVIHVDETSRLSMNNAGTIVFIAKKADGSSWLYSADANEANSKLQTLASTTTPLADKYELLQLRGDPGINSRGEVVFWADFKMIGGSGQKLNGLFTLPSADPLVLHGVGDQLVIDAKTYGIHDLWVSGGINDDRMISFWFSGPPGSGNKSFVMRAVP